MSSIFLQATTTTLLLLFLLSPPTTAQPVIIIDTNGNPLVSGSYYNALPLNSDKGGLVTFKNGPAGSCPELIVGQSDGDISGPPGRPIRLISQKKATTGAIINVDTSTPLNIAFMDLHPQSSSCSTLVWGISTDNTNTVVLNGVEGSPALSSFSLRYYVDSIVDGYRILYGDEVVLYNGKGWFNLKDGEPVLVKFKKLQ